MNMKLWLIFASIVNTSIGANILAFLGTNLHSHFRFMTSFLEHLSPYHNITLFIDPNLKYKHENISTIDLVTPSCVHMVNADVKSSNECNIDAFHMLYDIIYNPNITNFQATFDANVKHFLINTNKIPKKYDLLIYSTFMTEHFFPVSHKLNIPFVQISPSMILPWTSEVVGNPYLYDIDLGIEVVENQYALLGRIKKMVKNIILYYRFYWHYVPILNDIILKYYPSGTPGIEKIIGRTALIFVNTNNAMGYSRATTPTVVDVGGMHIKPSKPLPANVEKFVSDSGDNGFIYFSLGTLVQETLLSDDKITAIMNVLGKLPQKVLWKWRGNLTNVPSNVLIAKWFPQTDVLGHRKIKLFITQGGMLSMQESSYNGVPMLIMPVLFDQFTNAKVAIDVGYCLSLSICEFTEELFRNKIMNLLTNPRFRQTAGRISYVMQNEFPKPSDKINYWIDFVIRNNGSSLLRPIVSRKSWTEIVPADICIACLILISSTGFCFLFICYLAKKYLEKFTLEQKLKAA